MKRLILLILLLPILAQAQIYDTGTLQRNRSDSTVRGNFGSRGLMMIPTVSTLGTNGQILVFNSATNKYVPTSYNPTPDSTVYQTVANFFPKGDTRWRKSTKKIVYVSDYGDTYLGAVQAITAAGDSGVVVFSPGKTYLQTGALTPLPNQTWVGNGSVLKRVNETVTTLSVAASGASSSFTVSSVPSTWAIGDNIYINQDSSSVNGTISYRVISNIAGNVITLTTPIGNSTTGSITTWNIGTNVQKVFHQVTPYPKNLIPEQAAYPASAAYPFTVEGFNFDGSRRYGVTASWYINNAIFAEGRNIQIRNNNFYEMGNDCIDGHGFVISNNTFKNLNNSAVHLSAYQINPFTSEVLPPILPAMFSDNVTDSTNLIESASSLRGSRHSEGVITSSTSGGYINIVNNRISNANNAFYGNLIPSGNIGASSASSIVVTGNYIRNVNKLFFKLDSLTVPLIQKSGNLTFVGNTLDSCGTTIFPTVTAFNYDRFFQDMLIDNNLMLNGTIWSYPLRFRNNSGVLKGLSGAIVATGANDAEIIMTTESNGRGIYLDESDANKLKIHGGAGKGINEIVIDNDGKLTAPSLIKTGGTSSQFLKADGSVDASTYLTTAAASGAYLPLAGGTLTGTLNSVTINASNIIRLPTGTPNLTGFTGPGLEFFYQTTGDAARVMAYDRTAAALKPLELYGSSVRFAHTISGGNRLLVTDNDGFVTSAVIGSGLSLTSGTLTATGGSAGTINGSGTSGKLTKFTGSGTVGDSGFTESGSTITTTGYVGATSGFYNPAVGSYIVGVSDGWDVYTGGTNSFHGFRTSGGTYRGAVGATSSGLIGLLNASNSYVLYSDMSGNTTALGTIAASNFSGSHSGASSGTNTGDQNLSGYAPLASPALTGSPTAPTQTAGDNSTKIATTAYVDRLGGGTIASGTYTPTLTNGTNVASSSATLAHYSRVGNEVTVTGQVSITVTYSAMNTVLGISLPIASNFASATDLRGVATPIGYVGVAGISTFADDTNDRQEINLTITASNPTIINYSIMYTIIP